MKLGHSSRFNLQTEADRFVHASRDVGSRGTPPTVASAPPSRHHLDMRRDPTHQGTSDLFSSAPVDDTSRATPNRMSSADRPWHVLPKELASIVAGATCAGNRSLVRNGSSGKRARRYGNGSLSRSGARPLQHDIYWLGCLLDQVSVALPLLVLAWAAALAGQGSQKTIVQKV